jgi:hypothetical protein
MGMQQTYGGVARIIAPLFFGWAFDRLGASAPYFFSSAFILATVFLGVGLDQYVRPTQSTEPEPDVPIISEATAPPDDSAIPELATETNKGR